MSNNSSSTSNGCINQQFGNPVLGVVYIIHGTVYLPFYIPVVLALCRKPLNEKSCYKIMGAIGVTDIILLVICSYVCGYWCIMATSYCESWWQMKVSGALVNGCFITYCCLCIALGFNRVIFSRLGVSAENIFSGFKVWMWISCSVVIGSFHMIVLLSPYGHFMYHSGLGLFFYSQESEDWVGKYMGIFDNITFSVVIILLYSIVIIHVKQTASVIGDGNEGSISSTERTIIIQSLVVSTLAAVLALSYVIVPLFTKNPSVFVIISLYNQFVEGSNAIIYLWMNKAIRRNVLFMMHVNTQVKPITTAGNQAHTLPIPVQAKLTIAVKPATVR